MAEGTAYEGGTDAPASPDRSAELKAHVLANSRQAESWIDSSIAGQRRDATNYYLGKNWTKDAEGRSNVVMTEVRDTVQGMLPSLARVFFSGEKAVEFVPHGPEDVAAAEQATDYVNYIFQKDNPGFEIAYAAFKDALVRKVGVVKYWWDTSTVVSTHEFSGLSDEALIALINEPGVEVLSHEAGIDAMGAPAHSVTLKRRKPKGRVRIMAVPPEEFLVDAAARSVEDACHVEHRADKTPSDLIAMGYSRELVDTLNSTEKSLQFNQERQARNPHSDRSGKKTITYRECWTYFDLDDDGIDELLKVCIAGNEMVNVEATDHIPFATFCPDPEPHTFFGLSMADYTMDLQRIKSVMMRQILDSAVQSVNQRLVYVEGQVNAQDVLNNEMGGTIRARAPGMVQELVTQFLGQQAMPVIAYLDETKENRTGQSKAAMGLDSDAMQSTTKAAVSATVSAAAAKLELIARIFAEGGMRQLFRGILKLVTKHQDAARVIRLRNQWVPIDPRAWDADMDATANVAIGAGTIEDRIMFLFGIAQKQEQILATVGMDNPLVNPVNLYNTYAAVLELAGHKDPSKFFTDPRTWQPPPPKPSPEELLAQVEMEKNRGEMAVKVEQTKLEREKFVEQADFNRDKLDADIMLKVKEMELTHQTSIETAELGAKVSQDRIPIGSITKAITRSTEGAMEKVSEGLMKRLAELQAPVIKLPEKKKMRKKVNRDAKGNIVSVDDEELE